MYPTPGHPGPGGPHRAGPHVHVQPHSHHPPPTHPGNQPQAHGYTGAVPRHGVRSQCPKGHGAHGPYVSRSQEAGPTARPALAGRRRPDALRAVDVMGVLQEKLAILSGGRDKRGGALVTFPATPRRERAKPEDYKILLQYLIGVPSEDVRDLGLTVIIDMRGSTWTTVKPILKVLQEFFAHQIHSVHIIKPENFWQKQRTSLGSQKYKFEANPISLDSLMKVIDLSNLTQDLEGTLVYDHTTWIELRCALEDFFWQGSEMLDRLDEMREDLNHNDFADDVTGARKATDLHNEVKRKILKLPVENIDNVGQQLLQRLSMCESGNSYDSGYSGRDSTASNMTSNPDMQGTIPDIMQLLDHVHSGQQQLLQLWQIKKMKLDQCLQLRHFEQDCEKMFDWIFHHRSQFLNNYVSIGRSYQEAKKLQDDHNHFTMGSNNVFSNINRILSDAAKLIESSHYASQHVRAVAARLDKNWKDFAGCLDERTTVLGLSVLFHQKAETYVNNVSKWGQGCEMPSSMSSTTDITTLETSIHQHQSLYENMCQSYTEVHSTSKKLLYQLDHLVQTCSNVQNADHKKQDSRHSGAQGPKKDSAEDYTEGASHVLAVIHDILAQHRALEAKWHAKKIKLHQRLALRLFQEDVKQVLDWLQNHGEVFLRKNVGIGRSLQKARAYQKSHETFEGVVQNTYTNAEKLLAAAAELAQTGECNAEDIYSVAHELESHISSFAQRVEERRKLLELAIVFYSHTEELINWLTELKQELQSEEVSESLDGAERLIEQFSNQRDSTLDACASTIAEGKTLFEELKSNGISMELDASGSMSAVQTTLDRLGTQRDELGELWKSRKMRLDLGLQLRLFERDALELSSQYELWGEQLQNGDLPRDIKEAEAQLRNLSEHISHIQSATFEVTQRGQELLQLLENSGLALMSDSQYNGQTRVQVLLEYIQEREIDIEEFGSLRRLKLEQCIQLSQFEGDANQVIRWIQSAEGMLAASFSIPGCLQDAEQIKKEHEQFQTAIEKTHASAVHVRQRAETLFQSNHFNPGRVKEIADGVTSRWQGLVTRAEERHKLVTASLNFYKTAEQVCSVLDSLEKEYRRDDDWLVRSAGNGDHHDKVALVVQMINKHQEQKEAFLKACTLARRTAETFLKYSNRSVQYFGHAQGSEASSKGPEAKVKVILEKLLAQENRVLEYWSSKKKRLDQNQQFCLFERSARQSLAWIKEEGDIYLNTHHSKVGATKEETEALLAEHNSFKEKAKETREKVKLLLQLADTLVEKGHAHAPSIKQWVQDVDNTYKDFSTRMDEYKVKLEKTLGVQQSSALALVDLTSDRNSDASLDSKLGAIQDEVSASNDSDLKQIKEMNEEKRRSARRKEFIMAELLETERSYVKDLESAINCFLRPLQSMKEVPLPLRGKEDIIFGNLEEILGFHKSTFLKALEKYESMPEDVGHCFVTWAQKFDIYVKYCTNKPHSTQLLVQHGGNIFETLQRKHKLEHPIAAYLIKPVQRITKYQLLLKDLLSCCNEANGEINEGLEVCLNVPKKANDALHLSLLDGCDVSLQTLGEVVLQECFQVLDSKQIIRKMKERHIFLFDLYLVIAKEIKDSNGKSKYSYKSKLMTSEMGVTEHIEGDDCKFAIWTGRTPMSENKLVLKGSSIEVKQLWVRKLRETIQETYFSGTTIPNLAPTNISTSSTTLNTGTASSITSKGGKSRLSRDFEDGLSLDGSIEQMDRGSLASFGSGATTDSENQKHGCDSSTWVISDFNAIGPNQISLTRGLQVEVLEHSNAATGFVLVRLISQTPSSSNMAGTALNQGLVPISCLKWPPHKIRTDSDHTQDTQSGEDPNHPLPNVQNATGPSSPVNKRKGFSGKWLPNIRKLSQGKLDKSTTAVEIITGNRGAQQQSNNTAGSGLHKQLSKNKLKPAAPQSDTSSPSASEGGVGAMGNKQSHSESEDPSAAVGAASANLRTKRLTPSIETDDGEDPPVEVPPPMQPISTLSTAASGTSKDLSTADQLQSATASLTLAPSPLGGVPIEPTKSPAPPPETDPEVIEKITEQRLYRLQELLESERTYVEDLGQCVEYIKFMRQNKDKEEPEISMPDDLKEGKDRMIFGNIEAIQEWHRDFFLKNLENCIKNPVDLGHLFKKYDRKFQMYVVYCQNKPKSEYIVSEHIDTYFEEIRLKLGFKLRLTDLLIKPIQRLTKYHMLLEAILKYSHRAGLTEEATAIAKAFHVMTVVPNQANDMMDIGRLQGFEGKITAQGKLLYRGPLVCLDNFSQSSQNGPAKMKPFTVFLFEQIMIFSETVGKKTQFTSPVYVYKAHFLVNKMALDEKSDDGDPAKFVIRSNDPARDELRIVCQAESVEEREKWVGIMKKQLQTQMDFLRALQAPIAYHSKLAKDSASDGPCWDVIDASSSLSKLSLESSPSRSPKETPPSFPRFENGHKKDRKSSLTSTMLSKKSFLEGLKLNSLARPRTKSDDFADDKGQFRPIGLSAVIRVNERDHDHSEIASPSLSVMSNPNRRGSPLPSCPSPSISPPSSYLGLPPRVDQQPKSDSKPNQTISMGTIVKAVVDYLPVNNQEIGVHRGQILTVIRSDANKGYFVSKDTLHGWVPFYVIDLLKKSPLPGSGKSCSTSLSNPEKSKLAPKLSHYCNDRDSIFTVKKYETAVLPCARPFNVTSVQWTRPSTTGEGPSKTLTNGDKYSLSDRPLEKNTELKIFHCDSSDQGDYQCSQILGDGATFTSIISLQVEDVPEPKQPQAPRIQDLQDDTAVLTWDLSPNSGFVTSVEACQLRSNQWRVVKSQIPDGVCIVSGLILGETYCFRIQHHSLDRVVCSPKSPPSQPLAVPFKDGRFPGQELNRNLRAPSAELDETWQLDFERKFIELEELGRGRYSVVRRCQEIQTGMEMAVKFVNRSKRGRDLTRGEYDILSKINHKHVVDVCGLFVTTPGSDAIVMTMVNGYSLLEYFGSLDSYTELTVRPQMEQLLLALQYIHAKGIAHLDLKPENVLFDHRTNSVKLIDFGSAREIHFINPNDPKTPSFNRGDTDSDFEFMAPELLSSNNSKVAAHTDMWNFGVLIYVALSGVSPFLDDSHQETINNILSGDFSFPREYFRHISSEASDLIARLLCVKPALRASATYCLQSAWIKREWGLKNVRISSEGLNNFIRRRNKKFNSVETKDTYPTGKPKDVRPDSLYGRIPHT
ncbi:triple functional domain protein-like isoform X1 [Tigriopus californicus]|uniref:triple functional domain protein-like isoform X1 n=1 Tax=Tigriopus californicus TaxID=6832 RepID=UPI0027DA071E|nr:triple functional domain protein-like isoform X1 [Tigriopus californicus]